MDQTEKIGSVSKTILRPFLCVIGFAGFLSYISLFLWPASIIVLFLFPFYVCYACLYLLINSISKSVCKPWGIKSSPVLMFYVVILACYLLFFLGFSPTVQDFFPHGLSRISNEDFRFLVGFSLPLLVPPLAIVIKYILCQIKIFINS